MMGRQLTLSDINMKAAGGKPIVYRSEDYDSLTSGSMQTITLNTISNSITLHNRCAYSTNNTILFYLNGVTNTPVTLQPGEDLAILKAWTFEITVQPSVDNPVWQIIVTL